MEQRKISDILDAAADLIEPPGKWTQGLYARNALGEAVDAESDEAVCFCLSGALAKVGDGVGENGWIAMRDLLDETPCVWNDDHSQAEVVAVLRQAAAAEREAGR